MWTYEKPTNEGWYLLNYGDVVTNANLYPRKFHLHGAVLVDEDYRPVSEISDSYKFMQLDISELNKLGNVA